MSRSLWKQRLEVAMKPYIRPLTSLVEKDFIPRTQQSTGQIKAGVRHPSRFSGVILLSSLSHTRSPLIKTYGMRDYKKSLPFSAHTIFRLASNTKIFTGIAIALLHEQKLLKVTDPVDKYLPHGLPPSPYRSQVTIHHLLTNTSGLARNPNYHPIQKLGFIAKPGSKYEYSNSNYLLLGSLIEKVTGLSYESFIRKQLILPLKLHRTGFSDSMRRINGKAEEYVQVGPMLVPIHEDRFKLKSAASMYSTATDMLKFNQRWHTLVKPSTISLINAKYQSHYSQLPEGRYGYGRILAADHSYWRHSGELGGTYSMNAVFPQHNVCLVFFSNIRPMFSQTLPLELLRHLKQHVIDKN
ncbi:serine hydrolase [Mechercharimyces sp. CAU 1602]|uniref:serine hydrolase domain-containing protein n=1 Tax=Mechercharimyces sp. CAU 1602 TaxID=2973933 RepID=UPI00216186CE|nr:serine hydrolase domain-containing protein [Mechercharimyces sp. CAU 1602]MCS1351916.1 beta-lactamase family protein [Mechercharimyces sp. CAU 1602]